jgi:hypothetical protein
MGPRVFTAREANALIPDLEKNLQALDRVRERLRQAKSKLDVLEMIWGEEVRSESNPDRREYVHFVEEVEQAKKDHDATVREIAELEGVVKSVDQGLVDFYGVIDSRLVFLCWKRGEKAVEYYHHLEDGFQGRQPIPSEELAR